MTATTPTSSTSIDTRRSWEILLLLPLTPFVAKIIYFGIINCRRATELRVVFAAHFQEQECWWFDVSLRVVDTRSGNTAWDWARVGRTLSKGWRVYGKKSRNVACPPRNSCCTRANEPSPWRGTQGSRLCSSIREHWLPHWFKSSRPATPRSSYRWVSYFTLKNHLHLLHLSVRFWIPGSGRAENWVQVDVEET